MKDMVIRRKAKAVDILKKLDVYEPYVEDFEAHNYVCFFERFAGFYSFQEKELQDKLEEIEKEFDCTVYAITHDFTQFGECYSFLIVTNYPSEWSTLVMGKGSEHHAFAYVWNKDCDWCSEFGRITVKSAFGGLTRIA